MAIQRMTVSNEARRSSIVTFERHVKSVLGARLTALEKLSKQLAIVNAPLAALIRNDERAMAALHELSPLVDAERKRLRGVRGNRPRNNRMFSLTTQSGLTLGIPPYDVAWTSGPIAGNADASNGTFECSALDTMGYEAVGLGIFISSTVSAQLRFSADALFHRVWLDLPIDPGTVTATEGGIGVLIYQGSNKVKDEPVLFWSDSQSQPWQKNGDEEWTYLTQTDAGQTYFSADAGAEYLIWVWSWVASALTGGNGLSSAHIDAQMPFVVVEQM